MRLLRLGPSSPATNAQVVHFVSRQAHVMGPAVLMRINARPKGQGPALDLTNLERL